VLSVVMGACAGGATTASPSTSPNFFAGAFAPLYPPGLNPSNLPPCQDPERIASPGWVPEDIPLPEGTYATVDVGTQAGYELGLFVVPGSLGDFATFVLHEWPDAGLVLGREESEPGEIDAQFSKAPAVGAIRARAVLCKPGYVMLTLLYSPDRGQVSAPPSVSPNPVFPSPTS
jgi:hypothetical protein